MPDLHEFLARSATLHSHLCPRQVLGVRAGLLAARLFDIALPQADKRLFAFVETDGCFVDGVGVATNCTLGHRTLRLMDYGKVAVTFVDTRTERAYRVKPGSSVRDLAHQYAPGSKSSWHAQLEAYQVMPDDILLAIEPVKLDLHLGEIISHPGARVNCARCGEEVMNERHVERGGEDFCPGCAGENRYYSSVARE